MITSYWEWRLFSLNRLNMKLHYTLGHKLISESVTLNNVWHFILMIEVLWIQLMHYWSLNFHFLLLLSADINFTANWLGTFILSHVHNINIVINNQHIILIFVWVSLSTKMIFRADY